MRAHEGSARSLIDGWNLLNVEGWKLTDSQAADVVRLRKPSSKSMRQTQKMESLLNDGCNFESTMIDKGLPLESANLKSEDFEADIVRLRQSSCKSMRHSLKLESSLHSFKSLPDKVKPAFHMTLVSTPGTKPVTDGNGPGNFHKARLAVRQFI